MNDAELPKRVGWLFDGFSRYVLRYVRRHFHAVRLSKSGAALPTDGEPILLEPAGATLNGGVIFDAPAGILKNWTATGAAAWDLPPGLKSGGYDVELTWSCAPGSGGEMLFKEDRYTMRRAVNPSASWEDYKTEIVGTLRLLSNTRLLKLTAATLKGEALLQLKSIRLRPDNGSR